MSKTISEGGEGATILFKPSKIKNNLKFYNTQILSVCNLSFIFTVNSLSVLACFATSESLFFMHTAMQ